MTKEQIALEVEREMHKEGWLTSQSACIEHLRRCLAKIGEGLEPTCWMTPDGEGWRMRTKPPENDVPLGWMPLYATQHEAIIAAKAMAYREAVAEAEQRVAEACAKLVRCGDHDDDPSIIAQLLNNEEWRKYL